MPFQRFVKQRRWQGLLLIACLLCACRPETADSPGMELAVAQPLTFTLLPSATPPREQDVLPRSSWPDRQALVARGAQLYLQQYCGVCHTLEALETKGTFGPSHDEMALVALQRLQDPKYTGAATTAADYVRESLVDPGIYLVEEYLLSPHRMPSYAHLPDEDIAALVEMLL